MIMIMKTYNSPMLQVVSIKRNDIVCGSPVTMDFGATPISSGTEVGAAGRIRDFDSWDAGY